MKFIRPRECLQEVLRTPHPPATREGMELMDRNERTNDFPPEVMAELRRRISPFALRAYPEPTPLYEKLAAWLGLPREMLLLTGGADGALRSVFETFVEPGDEVVCLTPSYAMVPVYCGISGAVLSPVEFDEDLCVPLERILSGIHGKTKLVVLANPNQPIERVFSEAEIGALLQACLRHGALLVMDEAYHHFCPVSALPFLKEYGNLVVVRTFSKAFGLAGVRLGYLVSRPENIVHLNKVRPMYEASSVAIALGMYLLQNDHLMRSYVEEVRQAREVLSGALLRLGWKVTGQWSNSILATLPSSLAPQGVAAALKTKGFLVRAETEPPLSNHLRITVGSRAQVERFVKALEAVVAKPRLETVIP